MAIVANMDLQTGEVQRTRGYENMEMLLIPSGWTLKTWPQYLIYYEFPE